MSHIMVKPQLGLATVRSNDVTITVAPLVPTLALAVSPTSGKVGDTFSFLGSFLVNEHWLPGRPISLYLGTELVGSGTTDDYGDYNIPWVADREGTLTFHTEGEYAGLGVISPDLGLSVGLEELLPWWWWIAAIGGAAAIITIAGIISYQEQERFRQLMMLGMR